MFVSVRIPVGDPHQAVLVQEQALGSDQGKKFLYVVEKVKNKDGKLVDMPIRRWVTVGMLTKGLRVIEDGLKPGERVIVNGLQRVRENTEVEPKMVPPPSLQASVETSKAAGE